MNQKQYYESPEVEIVELKAEQLICASTQDYDKEEYYW